jgi:hypothetical protein
MERTKTGNTHKHWVKIPLVEPLYSVFDGVSQAPVREPVEGIPLGKF